MKETMIEYIRHEDLAIINRALNQGTDVRLQRTPKGCRIVEDNTRVLVRKDFITNRNK